MKRDDCIFCKIANGEIPSRTLYEDETFRVILDLGPATKGHALMIPKDHADDLYDLLAKKMMLRMKDRLQCDGFNIVQNNGESAGQTVRHFHIHLIPRYVGDGQQIGWKVTNPSDEELNEIKDRITGE